MSIGRMSGILTSQKLQKAQEILTWTTPSLVIPALRLTQDNPEDRKELFIRDFTSYAIGGCSYFAGTALGQLFFKTTKLIKNKPVVNFLSFLTGLTGYLIYSGIGAVQLSKKLNTPKTDRVFCNPLQQDVLNTRKKIELATINNRAVSEIKPAANHFGNINKLKQTGVFDAFIYN